MGFTVNIDAKMKDGVDVKKLANDISAIIRQITGLDTHVNIQTTGMSRNKAISGQKSISATR